MTNRLNAAHSGAACRRWWAPAIVTLATGAALMALPAAPSANAAAKQAHPARPTEAMAPRIAGEPIMAIVSLKGQRVTIYDSDGWVLRAPVSSGIKGRETPAGVFAVVEKNKDHHSSLYDDAWMPNMLRITWNGIALHGGPLPGYAASHGCVRMPYGFAEKLFDKVPMGMRVIIAPSDTEPLAFSDPALFVPKQEAIDAVPARAQALAREADDATTAAAAAKNAVATAKRNAAAAQAAPRKLAYLKRSADAALAYVEKVLAAAKTDEAKAKAADVKQRAAAKVEELRTQLEAATAEANTIQQSLAAAAANAKTTEAKRIETAKAAKDAKLALEPVSIFISRATGKLYVRRDTHGRVPDGGEMYDTSLEFPVTIRNPDKPIGTHIFTAMARSGGGLRWTEVTIDDGDTAKDALDRITFPQEVLDRIAPTALPRSSITISDEPLSSETNYRTEFVVVLNDQPQGGFLNRARSPEMSVARDDNGGGDNGFFSRGFFGSGWGAPSGATRQRGQSYYPAQRGWW
jgi:L,D-transpeptidase catalytic domain